MFLNSLQSLSMKYSQKQLEDIQRLASIFMPISDMAVCLDVPPEILKADIRDYDSEARTAYLRGKAYSKAELLAQEMKLAKVGSPLGLQSTKQALTEMELDE